MVVLGTLPPGVFPFSERAARFAWALDIEERSSRRVLRHIDAVVNPNVYMDSRVSTFDTQLISWQNEEKTFAVERTVDVVLGVFRTTCAFCSADLPPVEDQPACGFDLLRQDPDHCTYLYSSSRPENRFRKSK